MPQQPQQQQPQQQQSPMRQAMVHPGQQQQPMQQIPLGYAQQMQIRQPPPYQQVIQRPLQDQHPGLPQQQQQHMLHQQHPQMGHFSPPPPSQPQPMMHSSQILDSSGMPMDLVQAAVHPHAPQGPMGQNMQQHSNNPYLQQNLQMQQQQQSLSPQQQQQMRAMLMDPRLQNPGVNAAGVRPMTGGPTPLAGNLVAPSQPQAPPPRAVLPPKELAYCSTDCPSGKENLISKKIFFIFERISSKTNHVKIL